MIQPHFKGKNWGIKLIRIAGIIGEGEILANWRITKIHQIKFQPNFMTTPTNTCYIITIEACEDVDVYVFPERNEGLAFTFWILFKGKGDRKIRRINSDSILLTNTYND